MTDYPIPFDEERRQRVLDETGMLDTARHPELDALTTLASETFSIPCSNISLVDRDRQWYASVVGPEMDENPRVVGFCAHTISQDRPLIVLDATADPRFSDNPAVTEHGVRFYAGAQVIVDGAAIGTFCLMDTEPRATFPTELEDELRAYAALVSRHVQAHAIAIAPSALPDRLAKERARLDRLARERAQFVSLVSHELRTPLNAVIGFSDLLLQIGETISGAERTEYVSQIKDGGERMHGVVESALRFAATNAGTVTLDERPMSLAEAARAAVVSNEATAALAEVTVMLEAESALPSLTADHVRCEQIVSQLVSNAIKFGAAGHRVHIEVGQDDAGRQHVEVRDLGPGFETLDPVALTTPFAGDANLLSRRADGLGLGLPLAYKLARLHGADLDLANGEPGARVTLTFPAYRNAAVAAMKATAA